GEQGGKPRFDDRPAYNSRNDDRPARRFNERAGSAERRPAHGDRDTFGFKGRSERGNFESKESRGYKGQGDRPAFSDRRGSGKPHAARPAGGKEGGFSGRPSRPSFGSKPAARGKAPARRGDFA